MTKRTRAFGVGGRALSLLGFVSTVAASGCATVGLGPAQVNDRVTNVRQAYEPREGLVGAVSVQSTLLHVDASKACELVARDQIARHTVSERRNETPAADWLFFTGGILAAGAGTVLLVDSSSTYSTDKTSTTYNPYGPGAATALGAGLIGVGVALLVVPTVDLFRAAGKVEKDESVEGPPRVVTARVACPSKPAVDGAVTVALERSFAAGKTGADGKLSVNLVDVVPVEAVTGKPPATATVAVDGVTVGTVPTGPLRAAREGAAWAALDRARCSEPSSIDGCAEVQTFLTSFPAGAHEAEGQAVLATAEPKLERLRDDKDWAGASSSACARPTEESACEGVDGYLAKRPTGAHAAEAKKLTRGAAPVLARLRAQREAKERADAQREAAASARAAAASDRQYKCFVACNNGSGNLAHTMSCCERCGGTPAGYSCQ